MKAILTAALLLVVAAAAAPAAAQSYYRKETALGIELFGTGGEASLQFEKIIDERYIVRTGLGLTGAAFRKGYTVPFGVGLLFGHDRNRLEVGVGGTWIDFDDNGDDEVIFDLTEDQVVGHAVFGYRFIGDYGFTYRLAFTPVLTKDGVEAMGGALFGYAF